MIEEIDLLCVAEARMWVMVFAASLGWMVAAGLGVWMCFRRFVERREGVL